MSINPERLKMLMAKVAEAAFLVPDVELPSEQFLQLANLALEAVERQSSEGKNGPLTDNEAKYKMRVEALEIQLSEEQNWHRHTKDKLAKALTRNSQMAGEFNFHFNAENRLKEQGNQL